LSPTPALTTIDVTLEASRVEVGQFTTASAVSLDQFAEPIPAGSAVFASSDPTVAAVSPTTGKILAIAPGTAQILATFEGRSGQRTLTVSKAPAIRVNEVQSNGDAPGGWVEFYNATSTSVDISGWTLTDASVFRSVVIPAGTRIPANGFLVIDESTFPIGLGESDGVRLFSRFGVLVDGYVWASKPATTYGRCADGTGDFTITTAPTKGSANSCSKTVAR